MANVDFSLVGGAKKPETSEDEWNMMLKVNDLIRAAYAKLAMVVIRTSLTGEDFIKLNTLVDDLGKAYMDSIDMLPLIIEKMKAE